MYRYACAITYTRTREIDCLALLEEAARERRNGQHDVAEAMSELASDFHFLSTQAYRDRLPAAALVRKCPQCRRRMFLRLLCQV